MLTKSIIFGNATLDTVKTMVAVGADVNELRDDGVTPLIAAILHDRTDLIKFLLEEGAYPEGDGSYDENPLTLAISSLGEDQEVVKLLLSRLILNKNLGHIYDENYHGYNCFGYAEEGDLDDITELLTTLEKLVSEGNTELALEMLK